MLSFSLPHRQSLDLCFVLDISGSMAMSFPNDSDRRSKLEVAVSCLKSILPQLSSRDRVAIVTFNLGQEVVHHLSAATKKNQKLILKKVDSICARGGTDLSRGLEQGFKTLHSASPASQDSVAGRSKRVLFMTDMQSGQYDEDRVILLGKNALSGKISYSGSSRKNNPVSPEAMFFSIIGIGVDLSVSTLRQVTAIPGARYISASGAEEFTSIVSKEFLYDVSPIAFNIRINLPHNMQFSGVFGASELSDVAPGSSSVTISSEFANPLREDGNTTGGVLLMRLQEKGEELCPQRRSPRTKKRLHSAVDSSSSPESKNEQRSNCIRVTWVDRAGVEQSVNSDIALDLPPLREGATSSENCDRGLRKAVALRQYVSCLEAYALKETDKDDEATTPPREVMDTLCGLLTPGLLALPSLDGLPGPIPPSVLRAHKYATLFGRLRPHLLGELDACGDMSLMSNNQNILQTVDQVVELESVEITTHLKDLRAKLSGAAFEHALGDSASCPKSFLCPITMELMRDPCIAVDGHSYERKAIEEWFHSKSSSPVTNLPIASTALVENYNLRSAIDQYVTSLQAKESGNSGDSSSSSAQSSSA